MVQRYLVIALVAISSIMTISDNSSESTAEYSSATDAYASLRMYSWVPTNVSLAGSSATGRCATVSWDRPDEALNRYMIGMSKNADFSNLSVQQWADSSNVRPQALVKGLDLNTKYYVRVYAVNPWNWEWSHEVAIFTTSNKEGSC